MLPNSEPFELGALDAAWTEITVREDPCASPCFSFM